MVNVENIKRHLQALAAFNATPGQGITRMAFSTEERRAREYLSREMESLGLAVYTDGAGNLFGRRPGKDPAAPAVMAGSHIDTVRHGGIFDGAAGVVAALETARVLAQRGVCTTHPIEFAALTEEEGSRFGAGLYGSRAMISDLSGELEKMDDQGITQRQAMLDLGLDPGDIGLAVRRPGSLKAFLELHIEQGPVLENASTDLGLVETIVGLRTIAVTISGQADHAGTTPMGLRRDALLGAGRLIVAVDQIARTIGEKTVATVGSIRAQPDVSNVVPAEAKLTIDLRAPQEKTLTRAAALLTRALREICGQLGLRFTWEQRLGVEPVRADGQIVSLMERAAEERGCSTRRMVSGAGHDAMIMAQLCPIGLLFVPSRGGKSHCPEEWTDYEDIARGTEVYLETVLALAK